MDIGAYVYMSDLLKGEPLHIYSRVPLGDCPVVANHASAIAVILIPTSLTPKHAGHSFGYSQKPLVWQSCSNQRARWIAFWCLARRRSQGKICGSVAKKSCHQQRDRLRLTTTTHEDPSALWKAPVTECFGLLSQL